MPVRWAVAMLSRERAPNERRYPFISSKMIIRNTNYRTKPSKQSHQSRSSTDNCGELSGVLAAETGCCNHHTIDDVAAELGQHDACGASDCARSWS